MHTLGVLSDLPPGYCVEETPRGILAVHVDVALPLHRVGFGPEQDGQLEPSDLAGRHPLRELRAGSERFLVRTFHHGGLLRRLTGQRFLDPERPFRELLLAHVLQRAGIRTPQVVAARARFALGPGFFLDIVTRRVEESTDLGRLMGRVQRGELDPRRLRAAYAAFGRLVRALHKQGVLHADLTPRNVLVLDAELAEPRPALWILDLDGSRIRDEISEHDRLANLRRILRHVERMQRAGGPCVTRTDCARFLCAYHRSDSEKAERPAKTGVRRWKEDWRAIVRERDRRTVWHSLGWWLDERFGKLSTLPAERVARPAGPQAPGNGGEVAEAGVSGERRG